MFPGRGRVCRRGHRGNSTGGRPGVRGLLILQVHDGRADRIRVNPSSACSTDEIDAASGQGGRRVALADTSEAEGLFRLKAEVDALIDEANALEVELRDEQERLDRFKVGYLARIAPLMARVEFLEAEVARARGEITDELIERADEAARVASERPPEPPERPAVDAGWKKRMKTRFRALARRAHPDLADGDKDRERREGLMARVNEAWANGDEVEIARLEAEVPEVDDGSVSVADRLAALVQSRGALIERVASLGDQLRVLRGSALESVRRQAEEARDEGRDLLAELAAGLNERIEMLEAELAEAAA